MGFDVFGYGWRDSPAALFHNAQQVRAYGESFGTGDVIGMFISLNAPSGPDETLLADPKKAKTPSQDADRNMGSRIAFYKNGRPQGEAYKDVYHGTYYPAAALYMGASVRFNFSAPWRYPPHELPARTKPLSERVEPIRKALQEERVRAEEAKRLAQAQLAAAAAAAAELAASAAAAPTAEERMPDVMAHAAQDEGMGNAGEATPMQVDGTGAPNGAPR